MFLRISRSPLHGQGCFTTGGVAAGKMVAKAQLLMFPPEDTELLLRTRLRSYVFHIRAGATEDAPYHSALAMGPISFCNHSSDPNCDFSIDVAAEEIALIARRPLAANEEITIDYGDYAEKIL